MASPTPSARRPFIGDGNDHSPALRIFPHSQLTQGRADTDRIDCTVTAGKVFCKQSVVGSNPSAGIFVKSQEIVATCPTSWWPTLSGW